MDSKANILYSNVGSNEAKYSLSFFVSDCGSLESAEKIKEEFDEIVKKHGGQPKE